MIKILYIVSTLQRTGPTNQLFYIIKYLDKDLFTPIILTLSDETSDSKWKDFEKLNCQIYSLNISRIKGLFFAKRGINHYIHKIRPDIIQSHGVRADSLLASMRPAIPWVANARNYPFEDYVLKKGQLIGNILAIWHISVLKKCPHVIACSKTISTKLQNHDINAYTIQNGVDQNEINNKSLNPNLELYPKPTFITVGGLNKVKNPSFVIQAFNKYIDTHKGSGSLIILGDGPEKKKLIKLSSNNNKIFFLGERKNIVDYYLISDYFISSSLSEGLPNAVIEAVSFELPVILSDIPSHIEIAEVCENFCRLYSLKNGIDELATIMKDVRVIFNKTKNTSAQNIIKENFSAEIVSYKYERLYRQILHKK